MQTVDEGPTNSQDRRETTPQDRRHVQERNKRRRRHHIVSLLGVSILLSVGMTGSAHAWGYEDWQSIRCNSGLYVSIHTRTTQDVTVEMTGGYGQRRTWGSYWRSNTFNTRLSYGSWRAYTSGSMNYADTYAYCSPY